MPLIPVAEGNLRGISKATCLCVSLIGLTLAAGRGEADTKPASWADISAMCRGLSGECADYRPVTSTGDENADVGRGQGL
jgi:hypothetical protein